MKMFPSLMAGLLILAGSSAWAQWQWLDNDGRKVFSDRAPPPDVAEKNIVKRPGARLPVNAASKPVADASTPAPAAPSLNTAGSGVDKDLEAKKKQMADEQASKRKAEEERYSKAKADNCTRAKQAKSSFDSGIRMARVNANGEREIMDDAARDIEQRRLQAIIDSDCK